VSASVFLDQIVAPWDEARRRLFGLALRVPPLAGIVRDRDRRVAAISTVSVAFGLALSLLMPAVLFALSPVVLGVPHVAADLRYLVLRRPLARWWKWAIFGTSAVMVALRIAQELDDRPVLLTIEVAIGAGWLLLAVVAGGMASRAWRRLAVAVPIVGAVAFLSMQSPFYAVVGLAHVHNVVAIGLWLLLFRRRRTAVLLPLALIAVALGAILTGASMPLTLWAGGLSGLGAELHEVSTWLVPGVAPELALYVTVAYVFLQALHYSVWLGWIPQEDVRAEGSLTFRMSARSLIKDFSGLGVGAIVLGTFVVVAFGAKNLLVTRDVYLSIAAFHGYLELATLAYLSTAGMQRFVVTRAAVPLPQAHTASPASLAA